MRNGYVRFLVSQSNGDPDKGNAVSCPAKRSEAIGAVMAHCMRAYPYQIAMAYFPHAGTLIASDDYALVETMPGGWRYMLAMGWSGSTVLIKPKANQSGLFYFYEVDGDDSWPLPEDILTQKRSLTSLVNAILAVPAIHDASPCVYVDQWTGEVMVTQLSDPAATLAAMIGRQSVGQVNVWQLETLNAPLVFEGGNT